MVGERRFELPPSCVIQTSHPHKQQLYWIPKEPAGSNKIPLIEKLNRCLAKVFGGDINATDASRILRIPGTFNRKYDPPFPVKILEINDREYNLSDFDFLPETEPAAEEGKPSRPKGWQEEGLGISDEVRQATAAYREEMDVLKDFLDEHCLISKSAEVEFKTLYEKYEQWCTRPNRTRQILIQREEAIMERQIKILLLDFVDPERAGSVKAVGDGDKSIHDDEERKTKDSLGNPERIAISGPSRDVDKNEIER